MYLGASLSNALLKPRVNDAVLDIWYGGSSLYGWDTPWGCLDRIPVMLEDEGILSSVGIRTVRQRVDVEVIGTESDYFSKLTFDRVFPQRDLITQLRRKSLIPVGGMCKYLRNLLGKIRASRIYGELRHIDPVNSVIRQAPRGLISFEGRIFNSMPVDYIAKFVKGFKADNISPPYITLYITTVLIRQRISNVKVWILGKRRFKSVAVISMPAHNINPTLSDYMLTYVIASTPAGKADPSARKAAFSDIKKLGMNVNDISLIRSHYEKYGILGVWDGANEFISALKDLGISCVGRLGSWRELSVEDLVREALNYTG